MCTWKKKDLKGIKKNAYIKEIQKKNDQILKVAEKNDLEKLEVHTDRFPLLELRKSVRKVMILIHMMAKAVIDSKPFENLSILVIITNSIVMIFDNPAATEQDPFFVQADYVFLFLYSVEMFLKIVGMGFIIGEEAYLKDSWNILDFVIVVSGYPDLFVTVDQNTFMQEVGPEPETSSSLSLKSLRTFRVMRPLKTISSIKGLKILMQALFSAIPLLKDTLLILMFFFIIFAIAGSQLLSGQLKMRCIGI